MVGRRFYTDGASSGESFCHTPDRSGYPNLKCLFTSGYKADVITHHGVLDEGVYFIQKPFSRKDLTAKVRETLNHKLAKK